MFVFWTAKAWRSLTPVPILALLADYREEAEQQIVVLFQILAAEINFGYKFQSVRCLAFNGVPLRNLTHLAHLVRKS